MAIYNGTANDDNYTSVSTDLNDIIYGDIGNDTLHGGINIDTIYGGDGADWLYGDNGDDEIYGGDGLDNIDGGNGYDTLYGGSGKDWIYGGSGWDYIDGESGDDYIQGDDGNDTVYGGTGTDVIYGGSGNDELYGDDGKDTIYGEDGDDWISGGVNADVLDGGSGNDTLYGGTGNDELYGDLGNDLLYGDDGADIVYGDIGNDTIYGGDGDDTLEGDSGDDWISAGDGDDLVSGGTGNDQLYGGGGNDQIDGGDGIDRMIGRDGNDIYFVDNSSDTVVESANEGEDDGVYAAINYKLGANVENLSLLDNGIATTGTGNELDNEIFGNSAANVLKGGAGNDTLDGGLGADKLIGGTGNDTYFVESTGDRVLETTIDASGTLVDTGGVDTVYSTLTNYTLGAYIENGGILNTGAANLTGNALNNVLYAGDGNNVLNGGLGNDTVSYANATAGVSVSLAATTAQPTGGSGTDTLINIENLTGSDYSDTLFGNAQTNVLSGGLGDDTYYVGKGDKIVELDEEGTDKVFSTVNWKLAANVENLELTGSAANGTGNELDNIIVGNTANNVLTGGDGNDTLTGGSGKDTFAFNTALDDQTNVDTITDFVTADDTISLDHLFFSKATVAGGQVVGTLAAGAFYKNAGATSAADASDRIILDTNTGDLYYDADGLGGVAAVKFATLSTSGLVGPVTNADFTVI